MVLAHITSLSRLVLAPIVILVLNSSLEYRGLIAAVLTALAGITDTIDGMLARRSGSTSKLGVFLDPAADKIFVLTTLFGLSNLGMIPLWVPGINLMRDLMINVLRSGAASEGVIISASWWGKVKTVVSFPAMIAIMLGLPFAFESILLFTALSVFSGVLYAIKFRDSFTG
ncbi:MAG: CDP-alcohol phosphatidyltransferase family protein [Chloroflexota bacterium]